MLFFTTCAYIAAVSLASATPALPGPPAATEQLLTLDVLVAAAQNAGGNAAQRTVMRQNGMTVAKQPLQWQRDESAAFWRAVDRLPAELGRRALALFVDSDVVTTEAHALLLSMLGPAPDFAVQQSLQGLSEHQLRYTQQAEALQALMAQAYRQADLPHLIATLAPALRRVQPSCAKLRQHRQLLQRALPVADPNLGGGGTAVLVAPLMAQDTGATLMLGEHRAVLLLGPSATTAERDTLTLHEMLHPRIAALLRQSPELNAAIDNAACLRNSPWLTGATKDVSQVYDGWSDYISESWVRGLSHSLGHTPQETNGFPLAQALAALSQDGPTAHVLAARAVRLLGSYQRRYCRAPAIANNP